MLKKSNTWTEEGVREIIWIEPLLRNTKRPIDRTRRIVSVEGVHLAADRVDYTSAELCVERFEALICLEFRNRKVRKRIPPFSSLGPVTHRCIEQARIEIVIIPVVDRTVRINCKAQWKRAAQPSYSRAGTFPESKVSCPCRNLEICCQCVSSTKMFP